MRAYVIILWISLVFLTACSWISSTYIKNNGREVVTIKLFLDSTCFTDRPAYLVEKIVGDKTTHDFVLLFGDSWPTCDFAQKPPFAFDDDAKRFATEHDKKRLNSGTCACIDSIARTIEINLIPSDSIYLGGGDHVGFATVGIDSIHMKSKYGSMNLNGNGFVQSAFQGQRNNDQILFTAPHHIYVERALSTENM